MSDVTVLPTGDTRSKKGPPWLLIGGAVMVVILLVVMLRGGSSSAGQPTTAAGTSINAALASLQEQNLNLMGQVGAQGVALGNQVTGVGDQVTGLSNQVAGVQSAVDANTAALGGVKSSVDANETSLMAELGNMAGNLPGPWSAYEGKIIAQGAYGQRIDPNNTWTYYVKGGQLYGIGSGASFQKLAGVSAADYATGKGDANITYVSTPDAQLRSAIAGVL